MLYSTEKVVCIVLHILLVLLFTILPSFWIMDLKDPTQSGKFFFAAYSIIPISIVFLLYKIIQSTAFKINTIDLLLLCILLLIIVNRNFIKEIESFSLRYYELGILTAVYIVLRNIPVEGIKLIAIAIVVASLIQSIHLYFQLYGGAQSNNDNFQITGAFYNPGPLGGYLVSASALALGIFYSYDNKGFANYTNSILSYLPYKSQALNEIQVLKVKRTFLIIILIVLASSIILTDSRASWIAIIVSSGYFTASQYNLSLKFQQLFKTRLKKILIKGFAVMLAIIVVVALFTYKRASAEGRLLIWAVSWSMILDQPWFGLGFDEFGANYMDSQAKFFTQTNSLYGADTAGDVRVAFCEPLQFVAENGCVISGIVLLLMFKIFSGVKTQENFLSSMAKVSLLAIFVFSFFSYPSQILPIKLNAIYYIALISRLQRPWLKFKYPIIFNRHLTIVMFMGIVIFSPNILKHLNRVYNSYSNWNAAYNLYQLKEYDSANELYAKAKAALKDNGFFMLQYGKSLAMNGDYFEAVITLNAAKNLYDNTLLENSLGECYQHLGNIQMAEQCYQRSSNMAPGRLLPLYLLAKMYNNNGFPVKAKHTAAVLLKKKVKVNSDASESIIAEMRNLIDN